jgi:hypothetical protein
MALSSERLPGRGWLLLPPLLLFLALLSLPEMIGFALPTLRDAYARDMLAHYPEYFTAGYRWFFLAAAAVSAYFMIDARLPKLSKLFACGLLTVLGFSAYVMPVVGALQQAPIKEAALFAKQHDYTVVMWRLNTPSFDVYSKRLVEKRDPRRGDVVLTKSMYLSQLGNVDVLYQKNGISLVRLLPDTAPH